MGAPVQALQITRPGTPRRASRHRHWPASVSLAALFLLVGATVGAMVFGIAALAVAYVLYRL